MSYGHAERTLATIRLLEAETREMLASLERIDPEKVQWLRDDAWSGREVRPGGQGGRHDWGG